MQLKPGDILIVKLGDPVSGWVPGPDYAEATRVQFEQAIKNQGLEGQVSLLITHYGVDAGTLVTEHEPGLLRDAQALITRQAAHIAKLEAAA